MLCYTGADLGIMANSRQLLIQTPSAERLYKSTLWHDFLHGIKSTIIKGHPRGAMQKGIIHATCQVSFS